MMGAGKSAVGRRLAARLQLPFLDSDAEIERAAGLSVAEIFARHGEAAFRAGERRVIARLLAGPVCVLSTGGGAFMDMATRDLVRQRAISIWLRADPAVLTERATRRSDRPLLRDAADPLQLMTDLLGRRGPLYGEADLAIESDNRPVDDTVERVLKALDAFTAKAEP